MHAHFSLPCHALLPGGGWEFSVLCLCTQHARATCSTTWTVLTLPNFTLVCAFAGQHALHNTHTFLGSTGGGLDPSDKHAPEHLLWCVCSMYGWLPACLHEYILFSGERCFQATLACSCTAHHCIILYICSFASCMARTLCINRYLQAVGKNTFHSVSYTYINNGWLSTCIARHTTIGSSDFIAHLPFYFFSFPILYFAKQNCKTPFLGKFSDYILHTWLCLSGTCLHAMLQDSNAPAMFIAS